MFKLSKKAGLVVSGAVAIALAASACSSSTGTSAKAAGKTSAPSSTTATSAQSTSASSAATSASDSSSASASASSTDTPAPDPTFTPPAITNKTSDWVERSHFKLKIDTVTYPYVPPASAHLQPGPNEEFLKIHVELANLGNPGAFSMMDMEVRDSTDKSILSDIVASDDLPANEQLNLVELKPGERQTGEVVFIAPKGAKGLRLVFKGTVMTDGQVTPGDPPVIDLGV